MIDTTTARAAAECYRRAGLAVLPIRPDGSKRPALDTWDVLKTRPATDAEVASWWSPGSPCGVGVVCGPMSGNLLVLDVETDAAWQEYLATADRAVLAALDECPQVVTPKGGRHVWVRLPAARPGRKLATTEAGACLIETRGAGHYVLAPGCPAGCHATGRIYTFARLGWLS